MAMRADYIWGDMVEEIVVTNFTFVMIVYYADIV